MCMKMLVQIKWIHFQSSPVLFPTTQSLKSKFRFEKNSPNHPYPIHRVTLHKDEKNPISIRVKHSKKKSADKITHSESQPTTTTTAPVYSAQSL